MFSWLLKNEKDEKEKQEKEREKKILQYLGKNELPANAKIIVGQANTTVRICGGDSCSVQRIPNAALQSSSPGSTQQSFYTKTHKDIKNKEQDSLLPPDWHDAMIQAAKQGCLFAFLNGLSEEFVTEKLTERNWDPDKIYWINQTIRAIMTLCFGSTLIRSLATPMINTFLVNMMGIKEEYANHLTTASGLAYDAATSPVSYGVLAISVVSGFTGSMFGGYAAKQTYKHAKNALSKPEANPAPAVSKAS